MNFSHYITDHFIEELRLDTNQEVISRLKNIKKIIIAFLVVNSITSFYAFNTLFNSVLIGLLAAVLFQFVFMMIYIVLFATVRKAEYLKGSFNKKQKIDDVVLNGVAYSAQGFKVDGPGVTKDLTKTRKGYSNIFIRTVLLLVLGIGPALFFAIMIHHPFTKIKYEDARLAFIENQIQISRNQTNKLRERQKHELDSLILHRSFLLQTIDSLKLHPDKNGYYLEDIAWNESKLKLFNEINETKIIAGLAKITSDSLALIEKEQILREHYSNADFFILRSKVARTFSPITFVLAMLTYLTLLLLPFFKRYSLLINRPDLIDDALESHYKKIVVREYDRLKSELKKSELVAIIEELLENEKVPLHKKEFLKQALALSLDPGMNYTDPAFRVNPQEDKRKFIEKHNLAKYIGK